ncbi:MAG: Alkyl hydroperoxide reductase/ Thiol specific antioxidant/ Mal allergen [Candidatus Woesebacteria bacterium GW2011_GWB1_43_14]|uniref:Alkyl hydroperoxide reductase/ Thiol specific antioxidant/ Mal allergen n=1 Tax=Candidatus Woesebacteria bacterium GW2011_GWB1_43_14 TaxID=1618578 RepID=A0A0G1DKF0_9BACT|nr:MAG: Alkyl hydroperoxide reductase/ Thiol specific antioxidant/ Mal allergen [Candidatus Woesebacteria bacterium GW2011_GWB1_43_14]
MRKTLIAVAIILAIGGGLFALGTLLAGKGKNNSNLGSNVQGSVVQTDDHHKSPPPADDTVFKSLLGKSAPEFTLEAYDGRRISLKDLKGKNVVIFFTEGAMCYPSCWDQMVAMAKESRLNDDKTISLSKPLTPYIIVDKEGVVRFLLDDADMRIRNKELLEELDKIS